MTGRTDPSTRGLVATLGVAVVVCALAAGPAAAAATPAAPCSGTSGTTAAAYFTSGDRLPGRVDLYPGTRVTLYVCTDGAPEAYGPAWGYDAGSVDGVEVGAERDASVVLRVTNGSDEADLAAGVTKKSDLSGPTVTVRRGTVVDATVADESVSLRFASADEARQFEDAVAGFRNATGATERAAGTLPAASNGTALVGNDSVYAALAVLGDGNVTAAGADLDRTAFAAAAAGDVSDARRVVVASDARSEAVRADAREDLEQYRGELTTLAGTARLAFGGALVVGALVGVGAGYLLARRTLSRVEADRSVSTATEYSWTHVAVPLGVGAAGFAVGLGGLALGGFALVGVLL